MKSLLYISILLITAYNLSAQQVIKGTVTDAGNGQPVDAATVQINRTAAPADLHLDKGRRHLHPPAPPSRRLTVCPRLTVGI